VLTYIVSFPILPTFPARLLIQQELGQEMRRLRHRASRCGNFLSRSRRWNSPGAIPNGQAGRHSACSAELCGLPCEPRL